MSTIALAEPTREEWLAKRRQGIGASDVAAIVGVDPYKTPLDLYLEKKGLSDPVAETWPMWWGTALEPVLLQAYTKKTGREARPNGLTTFPHPKAKMLFATPDAFEVLSKDGVELKAPGSRQADKWGPEETDEIPENYLTQVAVQMACTERPVWHVAAKLDHNLAVYVVRRNLDLEESLIEAVRRFWKDHIEKGVPPEPTRRDAEALKILYPREEQELRPATEDEAVLLARFFAVRSEAEAAEAAKDEIAALLKARIGENAGIFYPGVGKVTWKAVRGRTVTDWEAIARSYNPTPLEIDQHTKVQPGARRFLPTPEKGGAK